MVVVPTVWVTTANPCPQPIVPWLKGNIQVRIKAVVVVILCDQHLVAV